jgi:hypothetical protein
MFPRFMVVCSDRSQRLLDFRKIHPYQQRPLCGAFFAPGIDSRSE